MTWQEALARGRLTQAAYHDGRTDTLWLMAIASNISMMQYGIAWLEASEHEPAWRPECLHYWLAAEEHMAAALQALSDMGDERATAMLRGGL